MSGIAVSTIQRNKSFRTCSIPKIWLPKAQWLKNAANVNSRGDVLTAGLKVTMLSDRVNRGDSIPTVLYIAGLCPKGALNIFLHWSHMHEMDTFSSKKR